MTLKNNRTPLLRDTKLCSSFHRHMWIQTGVMVRKRLNGVMTFVTLTFDLWPWPFAWTSRLSMVITPENFRMIRWWEHSEKGVTDGLTDRQTDRQSERKKERCVLRAACSQLNKKDFSFMFIGSGNSISVILVPGCIDRLVIYVHRPFYTITRCYLVMSHMSSIIFVVIHFS